MGRWIPAFAGMTGRSSGTGERWSRWAVEIATSVFDLLAMTEGGAGMVSEKEKIFPFGKKDFSLRSK